jgi:hypothetical protein
MGICWYCHWGWAEEVADIYDAAAAQIGWLALHYGPAHIVWEDENFDAHSIQWCIDHASENQGDLSDTQWEVVVNSLKVLLAIPKEIRECQPSDYDEEHPENFPPKISVRKHGYL